MLRSRNRNSVLSFTDMATEKEQQVRLIIQSALDRAEKAQRLARRLIQAAIGRALRAEFNTERQEVPAHIRKLLNQCEEKQHNKQK
jgi:hypothetical protein